MSDKTFEGASRRLFFAIKTALGRKELEALGKFAIQIIKTRTRKGFGVNIAGGPQTRLKRLSASYIAFRKQSKDLNTSLTSPGLSNLTFRGILLDSLSVVNTNTTTQSLFINANRRRRKGGVTNRQIAEFQANEGRIFLNLSRSELLKVGDAYKKGLIDGVNDKF